MYNKESLVLAARCVYHPYTRVKQYFNVRLAWDTQCSAYKELYAIVMRVMDRVDALLG